MRLGIGEDLERQRVEAVAGQNRGRLAEGLVDGGLAVADVVIVHRGQVVMDQRIDVDALDAEAHAHRDRAIDAVERGDGGDEPRTQPRRKTVVLGQSVSVSVERDGGLSINHTESICRSTARIPYNIYKHHWNLI